MIGVPDISASKRKKGCANAPECTNHLVLVERLTSSFVESVANDA